jgi:hypothetical protein
MSVTRELHCARLERDLQKLRSKYTASRDQTVGLARIMLNQASADVDTASSKAWQVGVLTLFVNCFYANIQCDYVPW